MTPQTTFANANPWAALLALESKSPLVRRRYNFQYLKEGKRLYVEKERVRSASKALRLWINRHLDGESITVHEQHVGRPCVWWEYV